MFAWMRTTLTPSTTSVYPASFLVIVGTLARFDRSKTYVSYQVSNSVIPQYSTTKTALSRPGAIWLGPLPINIRSSPPSKHTMFRPGPVWISDPISTPEEQKEWNAEFAAGGHTICGTCIYQWWQTDQSIWASPWKTHRMAQSLLNHRIHCKAWTWVAEPAHQKNRSKSLGQVEFQYNWKPHHQANATIDNGCLCGTS